MVQGGRFAAHVFRCVASTGRRYCRRTAYVMAVPFEEVNNPNFTQCTDQNP
jgi:hypothetical protein